MIYLLLVFIFTEHLVFILFQLLKANEIPEDIDGVFRKFVHEKVASKSK